MLVESYFKLFVLLFLGLILTLNYGYQSDILKALKTVEEKCNTYTISIPRGENDS